ncbi:winged helix-turn-helix domain-containing protein [Sphingobium sp. Ant17]|uniref:winged helix-turn-helix domain-containing protein n=1 Tax=Sphingobium sp. Ant17 TaxID=1461752 RepID=UPI0004B25DF1|nr:winged helix-turn-helix domain-containing protein [Sphingobium sp. Ant17]
MARSDLSRNTHAVYRFKGFELKPAEQALSCRGTPVAVGGRAFDILTLLVERAGDVVDRSEIFARVWPGVTVHEHNLKVNVGNLRRVLATFDPHSEFVVTIAGRGYKFVAPVDGEIISNGNSRSALPGSHVLPPTPPHLFGREEAIDTIIAKTNRPGYVTIVGPGGAGKTSVAIECATRAAGCAENVAFADLAALSDPRFLVPALATALGVSMSLSDPIAGVIDELSHRELVFIIDNCEHVIVSIAALIERIAVASPNARIIATSREPLHTRSEHAYYLERYPVLIRSMILCSETRWHRQPFVCSWHALGIRTPRRSAVTPQNRLSPYVQGSMALPLRSNWQRARRAGRPCRTSTA